MIKSNCHVLLVGTLPTNTTTLSGSRAALCYRPSMEPWGQIANCFDFTTGENASVPLQNGGSQSESSLVSYMTISSKESDDDGTYYCRILHSGVSGTMVLTMYTSNTNNTS